MWPLCNIGTMFPMLYGCMSGCGMNAMPPVTSPYAKAAIESRTAALPSIFYPYAYYSPLGGVGVLEGNMSYQEAVDTNALITNPYYMPPMRANNNVMQAQAEQAQIVQQSRNDADKAFLMIRYSSLKGDVNNLVASAAKYVDSENLNDEQKKQLEAIKEAAEALQKKLNDMAKDDKNTQVTDAIQKVSGMRDEYNNILKSIEAFKRSVTENAGNADGTNNTDGTNGSEGANGTGGADGANGANGANGADGANGANGADGVDGNDGTDGYDEQIKAVNDKLEKEMKPAIEELMSNPKLSEEDKKKLKEKQEEIEKAIEEKKPKEEIEKLYNEMVDLVNGTKDKLEKANLKERKELADNCGDLVEKSSKLVKEEPAFVSKKQRQRIDEKQKALQAAILANKPIEEIKAAYEDLKKTYDEVNNSATDLHKEANSITEAISKGADGPDWGSSGENVITEAVRKINGKNVMAVLKIWQNEYSPKFNDECLLETIFGEFQVQHTSKSWFANYILNAMEQYAKDNGIYNEVSGKLGAVRSLCQDIGFFTRYGRIYEGFKDLVAQFSNSIS